MSAREAEGQSSGAERRLAEYLRRHPDFFVRHADLLHEIRVADGRGGVVSLMEYQSAVLRDENHQLRARLHTLVEAARGNEELSARLHTLTMRLLECAGLPELVEILEEALREDFAAEWVSVRLLAAGAVLGDALAAGPRLRELFEGVLQVGDPACGRLRREQLDYLFGGQAGEVGSTALIPLGRNGSVGLLAIGSRDPRRFYPGMGILFLRHFGELAGHAIRSCIASRDGLA